MRINVVRTCGNSSPRLLINKCDAFTDDANTNRNGQLHMHPPCGQNNLEIAVGCFPKVFEINALNFVLISTSNNTLFLFAYRSASHDQEASWSSALPLLTFSEASIILYSRPLAHSFLGLFRNKRVFWWFWRLELNIEYRLRCTRLFSPPVGAFRRHYPDVKQWFNKWFPPNGANLGRAWRLDSWNWSFWWLEQTPTSGTAAHWTYLYVWEYLWFVLVACRT